MSGFNHFMKFDMMKQYSAANKVPMPGLAVLGTGLMLVLSGLSLIAWQYVGIGLILLAVFLFFTTMFMHRYWSVPAEQKVEHMRYFMGNMMLLGAVLILMVYIL